MAEYIKPEKDRYIKLSQALEVLDSCACWWAHDRMELIPAADVRPVVLGKWKKLINTDFSMYECEQCHAISLGGNFCQNCGADMRGET